MTVNPDDIEAQIAADTLSGDAERAVGDRRVRKEPLMSRIDALDRLRASSSAAAAGVSCFIKTGMR
jgi:hypothetical protein